MTRPRRHGALLAGAGAVGALALVRRLGARWSPRGRGVLITGGSRGLGLALARELASRGARFALCGRDANALEGARAYLAAPGADVTALPCDVGDPEQVDATVCEGDRELLVTPSPPAGQARGAPVMLRGHSR